MNELKQKLLQTCNESGLSLEAMIFVLKDLWRDAEDTLRNIQNGLLNQPQEEKQEENK